MRQRFALFAAAIAIVLTVGHASADPHPAGLKPHKFNGPVAPVTEDGVTTFHIDNHGCSEVKYGDGRGESDCYNGNVRSTLGGLPNDRLGQSVEYRFDIQVAPGFDYRGWENWESRNHLPDRWDSRLRIASWEGQYLHNFLYMLKLDSRRGIDFLGRTCAPADRITEWNSFSMKVRWAADERGWIKVTCNDEVIYLEEQVATNQAPHCYITNQCEEGVFKNPDRINFLLGPVLAGFGHEWKKYNKPSQFTEIQPDGITIRMRNVAVTRGAELYADEDRAIIRRLQAHLNALGCNAGPEDGQVGPRTRAAALSCREFEDGVLPETLGLATASQILDLYETRHPVE